MLPRPQGKIRQISVFSESSVHLSIVATPMGGTSRGGSSNEPSSCIKKSFFKDIGYGNDINKLKLSTMRKLVSDCLRQDTSRSAFLLCKSNAYFSVEERNASKARAVI